MKTSRFISVFWYLFFLCRKFSDADTFLKFSKVDSLIGSTCPTEEITFRYENELSTIQCLLMCVEKENCYGVSHHTSTGHCTGCRDKFQDLARYFAYADTIFYRASIEYLTTRFKVVLESKTWNNAKENCETSGGQLVAFRSHEERIFIETYILGVYNEDAWLWIGGVDADGDQVFQWVDGSPANYIYINWQYDHPDNWYEQCIAFAKENGEWASYDANCDILMSSICELYL